MISTLIGTHKTVNTVTVGHRRYGIKHFYWFHWFRKLYRKSSLDVLSVPG